MEEIGDNASMSKGNDGILWLEAPLQTFAELFVILLLRIRNVRGMRCVQSTKRHFQILTRSRYDSVLYSVMLVCSDRNFFSFAACLICLKDRIFLVDGCACVKKGIALR